MTFSLKSPGKHFVLQLLTFMAACLLSSTSPANAQQTLSGHVPRAVAVSRAVNPLARSTRLNLAIGLPLRNQDELNALLEQLSDPASPNFGHYLSPEQFAAEYGPTEEDYQSLIQFARDHGLVIIGTHTNRLLLDVSGDTPAIERALHVRMMVYDHPTRGRFFAPDREPSLDLDLKVQDISGLDDFVLPRPMGLQTMTMEKPVAYVTGSGPNGYFIGKDFRAAYAPGVALTGSGQTVGLLEFDGFYAGDVGKNFAQAGLLPVATQTVLLDGFNGAPGSNNIEVVLDIMMASYMAPGLSKVIVYEGTYPNDVLNRMATDNLSPQLSSSWGFGINATTENIFKQYIAQGQSLLQASGDSGAYKTGVMAPADDPSLTVVGGTSLTTAGAGGPWQSEKVWSGSGGGISTVYPIPAYQQGLSMSASGGSTTMRNLPDVALTADIQMFLIQNNGAAVVVGGTSAAAPLWAGFIALANQQAAAGAKPRLGFLNPLLYAIGKSSAYSADFNDIRSGNNNGFSAVSGYDLTTGWGSPAGQHLMNDLAGSSAQPGFSLSTSASSLTVARASSVSSTVSIVAKSGFNGLVSLGVFGLPGGVTAAFSPPSTASASSLTFIAGSTATLGSFPITVTGTAGTLSSSASINLTVLGPPSAASMVNLSPAYNVTAMVTDGAAFTGGGLDGGLNGIATAYSANLIGVQQTIAGTPFSFGPPNVADAVSAKTVALPTGKYSTISLLATGVNGNQPGQMVKVTYTDGTTSVFTQSISDWFTPQGYPGETKALTLAYRDTNRGQRDSRTFNLYEYKFVLTSTRNVATITLPNNRNVVVLAATLTGATGSVRKVLTGSQ